MTREDQLLAAIEDTLADLDAAIEECAEYAGIAEVDRVSRILTGLRDRLRRAR